MLPGLHSAARSLARLERSARAGVEEHNKKHPTTLSFARRDIRPPKRSQRCHLHGHYIVYGNPLGMQLINGRQTIELPTNFYKRFS